MSIKLALQKLAEKEDLQDDIARIAATEIMTGEATDAQIAGFLMGLKLKGEKLHEIMSIQEAMLEKAIIINPQVDLCIDTCGTGGDGQKTFNISTAVAFVVAASGIPVAKHGNRAVSSTCGSADVLEELGAKIDVSPDISKRLIEEIGFAFLFAPLYHPGMKYAAGPRRELGVRTIFNFIGPILNPALAQIRCVGVPSPGYLDLISSVLEIMGVKRALVYSSEEGVDEISLGAVNDVVEVSPEGIRKYKLAASDLGLKEVPIDKVRVNSVKESASVMVSALSGEEGPYYDYLLANSALALYAAGEARNVRDGVEMAKRVIEKGDAIRKLKEYVEESGGKLELS